MFSIVNENYLLLRNLCPHSLLLNYERGIKIFYTFKLNKALPIEPFSKMILKYMFYLIEGVKTQEEGQTHGNQNTASNKTEEQNNLQDISEGQFQVDSPAAGLESKHSILQQVIRLQEQSLQEEIDRIPNVVYLNALKMEVYTCRVQS